MADQPIFDTNPRNQYTAAASETIFNYTFRIFREEDIAVYKDDVLQTLTSDYTVTGVNDANGGTIVFVTPLAGGEIVTVQAEFKFERLTDFSQAGKLDATVLNEEQDKEIAYMQELRREIARKPGLAVESTVDPDGLELPDPVDGRGIYWDGTTGKLVNTSYSLENLSSAASDAQAAATLAQEWATKTDGLVDGTDYSAKFYAQSVGVGGGSSQEFDTFTATAAQTNFTLSNTPKAVTSLLINGNAQSGDAWDISGDDVVLTTPATLNDSVKIDYLTSAALITRNIGDNADVTITSPSNGDGLFYNSTSGEWENSPPAAVSIALNDVTDVTITAPSTNEVLTYDGAGWVNSAPASGTGSIIQRQTDRLTGLSNITASGTTATGITTNFAADNVANELLVTFQFRLSVIGTNGGGDVHLYINGASYDSYFFASPDMDQQVTASFLVTSPTTSNVSYDLRISNRGTSSVSALCSDASGYNLVTIEEFGA